MCGISGIFCLDQTTPADIGLLRRMNGLASHRGPDDEGYFLCDPISGEYRHYSGIDSSAAVKLLHPPLPRESKAPLGLGFRRLSILDLSESGHQPMHDPSLGLAIVFNGEVYNYLELREELKALGYEFSSQSDTEVILKAYQAWGEGCVARFNGIWAFALWDQKRQRLFCSRDRFGVKPFYYCLHANTLHFASEIKQLLLADVDKSLNQPMLWRSMKINSLQVYGSQTFWNGIQALEPGHNLVAASGKIKLERYHRLDPASFGSSRLSFPEAVEQYQSLFQRAVKWQLRADVEVGSCLSGGLDSSAIVCAASRLAQRPLQTFSSYFADLPALDERTWIDAVASQCGCVSHLTSPTVDNALNWFHEATWFNDLPVGAGFAAQYGVMKLAQRTGVKVLLDGQGSDELTGGYKHGLYRRGADLLRGGKLSQAAKELSAFLKATSPAQGLAGMGKTLLAALLPESRLYGLEFSLLRFEPFSREFLAATQSSLKQPVLAALEDISADKLSNFLYNLVYTASLPTLLHWEDRMSMAASVESRVPFLDHELAELAFSLPAEFKIQSAQGKYIHRQAMRGIVPQAVYERQGKSVFGSPFHQLWLRGGMKQAVETLLASAEFRQRGIWDLPKIGAQWRNYLRGDNSQAEMLFNVFALETWFRVFAGSASIK